MLLLLTSYLGIAAFITLKAPQEVWAYLYSEAGPYEVFSAYLWLLLSILALFTKSMQPSTRLIAALMALMLGARELDMHKSLFSMSFIKTNFYKSADISLQDKLVGGLILLAMIILLVCLLVRMWRHFRNNTFYTSSSFLLFSGLLLGILSKVLDRFSSQMLKLFQITLPPDTRMMIIAFEESLEMVIPLLLALALLAYQKAHAETLDANKPS